MDTHIRKLKNFGHLSLALTANLYNQFPGRKMVIIGVTGTDGKTTTSNLIYHILKKAGLKTALISTLGVVIDDEVHETGFHVTTPSPFSVQKYLRVAKKKGCTHVVIETTSHALDQNRVWGIHFNIGVLTNITHEHLDYHKSYEKYVSTKIKLLKQSSLAVVNSNGEWFSYVKKKIESNKLITYSLHGKEPGDITLMTIPFKIKTKLIGDFNLENILAAVLVSRAIGIDDEVVKMAIEEFDPPRGRQEIMSKKPLVMIDFAHTPNSFENILPTLRQQTSGKLIHVFGSAGERDRGKRPEMGKVASYYDDIIVLTAEDPRSESVEDINNDIKKGISKDKELYEINDRKKAIEFAISNASENDTVVITGKGHEKSMNLGKGEIEWSDQKVVLEILKK